MSDNPTVSGVLLGWRSSGVGEGCLVVEQREPATGEWRIVSLGPATATATDDRDFLAAGRYCYRLFTGREGGSR